MKEASFALRYFFSDRCMFIENAKDWFLKQIKSVSFKEQKLWISDLRGVIVIVFVVPISNNFHNGWSFWEEFIWRVLFRYWSRNHCIATWFRHISISPAIDGLRSLNLNKRYNIWKKNLSGTPIRVLLIITWSRDFHRSFCLHLRRGYYHQSLTIGIRLG